MDVVIVGAGLAGLAAARRLADEGLAVVVVDKARGVGGRLAMRRLGAAVVEHGAQVVTARTPEFARQVEEWRRAGVVKPWPCVAAPGGGWRGVPAMTAPAKALAQGVELRLGWQVASVALDGEGQGWLLQGGDGSRLEARAVLLGAPAPQSLAMLDAGGVQLGKEVRARLEAVAYEPCLAVLAVLERGSRLPAEGQQPAGGPLAWLADQQSKGVSPVPAAVLHSTGEFAESALDGDREAAARILLEAAGPRLGSAVTEWQVHGWRYSRVTRPDPDPFLVVARDPLLLVAGDAWGGSARPRHGVEDAYLSGHAAGAELAAHLTKASGR